MTANILKELSLIRSLHSLRHHIYSKFIGHGNDIPKDYLVTGIKLFIVDKRPVDLNYRYRKIPQSRQR